MNAAPNVQAGVTRPPREHWQALFRDKSEAQTSWVRAHLDESLQLIEQLQLPTAAPIIDVGAGRSSLADDLLARGFSDLTVLDIAEPALQAARSRLGNAAARVHPWGAAQPFTYVVLRRTGYQSS